MKSDIISYGNIILTPTPSPKYNLIPAFSLLLEAAIHLASTNIICSYLEVLLVSPTKEMISSFLTSKANPGKKSGQMNSPKSKQIELQLIPKYFRNHPKSPEPIPSQKKFSSLLLDPTKNPQKHKNSQAHTRIHLQTKSTAFK